MSVQYLPGFDRRLRRRWVVPVSLVLFWILPGCTESDAPEEVVYTVSLENLNISTTLNFSVPATTVPGAMYTIFAEGEVQGNMTEIFIGVMDSLQNILAGTVLMLDNSVTQPGQATRGEGWTQVSGASGFRSVTLAYFWEGSSPGAQINAGMGFGSSIGITSVSTNPWPLGRQSGNQSFTVMLEGTPPEWANLVVQASIGDPGTGDSVGLLTLHPQHPVFVGNASGPSEPGLATVRVTVENGTGGYAEWIRVMGFVPDSGLLDTLSQEDAIDVLSAMPFYALDDVRREIQEDYDGDTVLDTAVDMDGDDDADEITLSNHGGPTVILRDVETNVFDMISREDTEAGHYRIKRDTDRNGTWDEMWLDANDNGFPDAGEVTSLVPQELYSWPSVGSFPQNGPGNVGDNPPIANAGSDQNVWKGDSVQLDGSNSYDIDNGDNVAQYNWTAPTGITLTDANTSYPSFTAPTTSGDLTFSLTVVDSRGNTSTNTDDVIITVENRDPYSDAGSNQTVQKGDPVTLDGSASDDDDPGETVDIYQWVSHDPRVTLTGADTVSPTFTAPDESSDYWFSLIVYDAEGAASGESWVRVRVENNPPIADAGADFSAAPGTTVTLDGSNSYDNDNNDFIQEYRWVAPAGVTLTNDHMPTPTFTAPAGTGPLVFTLYVRDSEWEESAGDEVTVTIENSPPVADAGPAQTVEKGVMVTLDGSGSDDPDPGDGIDAFQWTGPVALIDSTTVSPRFTAPNTSGTLTFELIVTDQNGEDSAADQVIITVNNNAPVANAGLDQTVAKGDPVTLDGSGSVDHDAGDGVAGYQWTSLDGVSLTGDTTVNPSFTAPSTSGPYRFSLVVTDSEGLTSAASEVTISVDNQAPIADAGPDQDGILKGATVQLDGTGSDDPDVGDTVTGYQWVNAHGITINNATTDTPTFTAPTTSGDYTFELVVVDGEGLSSASDAVVITVVNRNPVLHDGNLNVDENSTPPVVVGDVVYSEPDGEDVTFSITAGNDGSMFVIDPNTGAISTAGTPDCETQDTYTLTVFGDDGYGGSDTASITVTITDVGDNAPVFTDTGPFEIWDSTVGPAQIGTVIATDADTNANLVYSITGGDTPYMFEMSTDGVLSVIAGSRIGSDRTLTVQVEDRGQTATASVEIVSLDDTIPSASITASQDFVWLHRINYLRRTLIGYNDGLTVTLTATVSGGNPPFSYQWYRAESLDGPFSAIPGETSETLDVTLTAGEYEFWFEVTDVHGDVNCCNDIEVRVAPTPPPTLTGFTETFTDYCVTLTPQVENLYATPGFVEWTVDGVRQIYSSWSHQDCRTPGVYTASLRLIDDWKTESTYSADFRVPGSPRLQYLDPPTNIVTVNVEETTSVTFQVTDPITPMSEMITGTDDQGSEHFDLTSSFDDATGILTVDIEGQLVGYDLGYAIIENSLGRQADLSIRITVENPSTRTVAFTDHFTDPIAAANGHPFLPGHEVEHLTGLGITTFVVPIDETSDQHLVTTVNGTTGCDSGFITGQIHNHTLVDLQTYCDPGSAAFVPFTGTEGILTVDELLGDINSLPTSVRESVRILVRTDVAAHADAFALAADGILTPTQYGFVSGDVTLASDWAESGRVGVYWLPRGRDEWIDNRTEFLSQTPVPDILMYDHTDMAAALLDAATYDFDVLCNSGNSEDHVIQNMMPNVPMVLSWSPMSTLGYFALGTHLLTPSTDFGAPAGETDAAYGYYARMSSGDLDNDGIQDLVSCNNQGGTNGTGYLLVLYGGTSTFLDRHDFPSGARTDECVAITVGDVNGDTIDDLVRIVEEPADDYGAVVHLGSDTPGAEGVDLVAGTVALAEGSIDMPYVTDLALSDMDDDGFLDLVAVAEGDWGGTTTSGKLAFFRNTNPGFDATSPRYVVQRDCSYGTDYRFGAGLAVSSDMSVYTSTAQELDPGGDGEIYQIPQDGDFFGTGFTCNVVAVDGAPDIGADNLMVMEVEPGVELLIIANSDFGRIFFHPLRGAYQTHNLTGVGPSGRTCGGTQQAIGMGHADLNGDGYREIVWTSRCYDGYGIRDGSIGVIWASHFGFHIKRDWPSLSSSYTHATSAELGFGGIFGIDLDGSGREVVAIGAPGANGGEGEIVLMDWMP